MSDTATVTSKSMINIPARIRRRYGLGPGSKVAFVETEDGVILVPLLSLGQLRGIDSARREAVLKGIRELELDRRREALAE